MKSNCSRLIFFFILTLMSITTSSGVAAEVSPERIKAIAESTQWQNLLHFKHNMFGLWRSQLTGPGFFLAADGYKNPESELVATIQALQKPLLKDQNPDDHPACIFLGRKKFLQAELPAEVTNNFLDLKCPLFEHFVSTLHPDRVSFVFSSYHVDVPDSAFAHIVFRFDKHDRSNLADPTKAHDQGIGFMATVTTTNFFLYPIYGTFGVFKGEWTNVPRHHRVREYNNYEARDIWSYELNLTPYEIDFLIRHIWELSASSFSYYFLTQNCAWHMLTTLEAIAPRLQMTNHISLGTIPADTIRLIKNAGGIVGNPTWNPSVRRTFFARYHLMSPEDQTQFVKWTKSILQEELLDTKPENKLAMIDTAVDYIEMKFPRNPALDQTEANKARAKLASLRNAITTEKKPFVLPTAHLEAPDLCHGTQRWGLSGGQMSFYNSSDHMSGERQSVMVLDYRATLHDFLDPVLGMPKNSTMEVGNFRLQRRSYLQPNSDRASKTVWDLLQADFYKVTAFNPVNEFEFKPSWRVRVGVLGFARDDEIKIGYGGAFGIGYSKVWGDLLGYSMVDVDLYTQQQKVGLTFGSLYNTPPWSGNIEMGQNKINIEARYQWFWSSQLFAKWYDDQYSTGNTFGFNSFF